MDTGFSGIVVNTLSALTFSVLKVLFIYMVIPVIIGNVCSSVARDQRDVA